MSRWLLTVAILAAGTLAMADEPTSADKAIVSQYLDAHFTDPNYTAVAWFARPPREDGRHAVYVTLRFTTPQGGPGIETILLWVKDGEVTQTCEHVPFPGSPEDKGQAALVGALGAFVKSGASAAKPKPVKKSVSFHVGNWPAPAAGASKHIVALKPGNETATLYAWSGTVWRLVGEAKVVPAGE